MACRDRLAGVMHKNQILTARVKGHQSIANWHKLNMHIMFNLLRATDHN